MLCSTRHTHCRDPPENFRRALTQALDLGQLGQVVTSGTGQPATGLVAPGMGPCKQQSIASSLPSHDVNAARSYGCKGAVSAGLDER